MSKQITIDPLGLSLVRLLVEAEEDIQAIKTLPREILMNGAFHVAFTAIGKRDQCAQDFADHLVYMPCTEIDIDRYHESFGMLRLSLAHGIGQKAIQLYREMTASEKAVQS